MFIKDVGYPYRQFGVIKVDTDKLYKWFQTYGLEVTFVTDIKIENISCPIEFYLLIDGYNKISDDQFNKINDILQDYYAIFGTTPIINEKTGFPAFKLLSFSQFILSK